MYFKLKSQYVLRGWKHAAWALIIRPYNYVKFLKREEFETLILCDGVTDLSEDMIDLDIVNSFTAFNEKVIEKCEVPTPLDDDQYYRYYDNRFVSGVFWSITGKCNYKCRHCFMDAPDGIFGELDTESALNLIDQMNECGVLAVDITGGEPLIRHDFWQLIDRILSYKIAIHQIYTNGWLVNEKLLDEFEKRGIKPEIHISFDGIGCHDWMRGIKGAEDAALRAFKLCKERGFETYAQMCMFKDSVKVLPETVKVLSELGVNSLKGGHVSNTELWCKNSENNAMTLKEYLDAMLEYIPKFFEQGRLMDVFLTSCVCLYSNKSAFYADYILDRSNEGCTPEKCYLCMEARYTCYVGPDGRVIPCMPMTAASQNVQEKFPLVQKIGLKNALSDGFYMDFIDKRVEDLHAVNKKCANCEYKYLCGGGCRANAVINGSDDLMGCDQIDCFIFKNGYYERIKEVTEAAIKKYCTKEED